MPSNKNALTRYKYLDFLAKHGWVLDYGKQEIVIPDTDVSIDDLKIVEKRIAKE